MQQGKILLSFNYTSNNYLWHINLFMSKTVKQIKTHEIFADNTSSIIFGSIKMDLLKNSYMAFI